MSDREKLAGTWRLVTIHDGGKVRPERGANPTGFITYHPSGAMHVCIQPDRPSVGCAGAKPTGEEALKALYGYTSYFGTFSIDETKKIVTHHKTGSVQPGWEREGDVLRGYRFESEDRVVLRAPGSTQDLVWERVK